jgi:hypothetical protein
MHNRSGTTASLPVAVLVASSTSVKLMVEFTTAVPLRLMPRETNNPPPSAHNAPAQQHTTHTAHDTRAREGQGAGKGEGTPPSAAGGARGGEGDARVGEAGCPYPRRSSQ